MNFSRLSPAAISAIFSPLFLTFLSGFYSTIFQNFSNYSLPPHDRFLMTFFSAGLLLPIEFF